MIFFTCLKKSELTSAFNQSHFRDLHSNPKNGKYDRQLILLKCKIETVAYIIRIKVFDRELTHLQT